MSATTIIGGIKTVIVSSEHGFDDIDITGVPQVHRVCVPHGIKHGDTFNVYCEGGVKQGAIWRGSVERSLSEFSASSC